MEWMILPYKRYADFSGRSRRMEYWMFNLFFYLVLLGILIVFGVFDSVKITGSGSNVLESIGGIIIVIFVLGSIIPHLSVTVRRLHDQDKSGWYYLLSFIPYIGGLILLVFMCSRGTYGENQYGFDPLHPELDTEVFS
jgi:uncharacterized membrane protein YhaH (DUF805 family)